MVCVIYFILYYFLSTTKHMETVSLLYGFYTFVNIYTKQIF